MTDPNVWVPPKPLRDCTDDEILARWNEKAGIEAQCGPSYSLDADFENMRDEMLIRIFKRTGVGYTR